MGDGHLAMSGVEIILIISVEVGRFIYCEWHHSLARIQDYMEKGSRTAAWKHSLIALFLDSIWGASCFKLLLP